MAAGGGETVDSKCRDKYTRLLTNKVQILGSFYVVIGSRFVQIQTYLLRFL